LIHLLLTPYFSLQRLVASMFVQAHTPSGRIECPCCKRDLESEKDIETFESTLRLYASDDSPLSKMDKRTKVAMEKYKNWCEVVKGTQNDVMEYQRLRKELFDLENRVRNLEPVHSSYTKELQEATQAVDCINGEVSDLREMQDSSKRWVEAAMKIAVLRERVCQKEDSFPWKNSDKQCRDLKQVTNDIAELEKKKDDLIEKVNALNKEMSKLNDEVSSHAQTATRLEGIYRSMQEKYDEDLKLEDRKNELISRSAELKTEHEQVRILRT
jgi:chromosome segregation ATPase